MATLLNLYNMRRTIAEKRQSSHLGEYTKLHDFLVELKEDPPYDQPYNLPFETKLRFEELDFFINKPFGSTAKIPARDQYAYRICTIVDVVKGTSWRDDEGTDAGNWMQVYSRSKNNWAPLSDFADGSYKCRPRCVSWWTSYPLLGDVISGAHRIGMTNDWVAIQSVILRCPIDYINNLRLALVPTVIDAFMQLIFHPTKDAIKPGYGLTIDLSLFPVILAPGVDEIVIPEISIEPIEIRSVNVDKDYRKGKNNVRSDSERLSELLESYYEYLER